ncbi:MAG: YabP/YqfC family sporulation protein [Clostridia bacterium]|nr:YabP/YqfC family sporulation protein [Clostridia bacterium]
MQENNTKHTVSIEQRKSITVSGVESVSAFSEIKIALTLIGGEKMYVVGTGLKITAFSKSSGSFTAEGNVSGVSYGGKSFASKLFR